MNTLQDKVAFITGGTKGIGYGIAEALIEQGMRVVITGREIDSATGAAAQLKGKALGLAADVRDLKSMEVAVKAALDHYGQIDLLIANAGVGHFAPIDQLTSEQWNATIDTNLTGVFNTVKAGLNAIKKAKGYIITISSLAGLVSLDWQDLLKP